MTTSGNRWALHLLAAVQLSSWQPPGQEVGGGVVAAHPVAPPELPLVGQSQKDLWMDEGGEGGVEVLLQVLVQQALVRKMFLLKKKNRNHVIFLHATRVSVTDHLTSLLILHD